MKTIDATPTWEGILPILIMLIENGSGDGRKTAIEELTRMAKLADLYVDSGAQSVQETEPTFYLPNK